MTPTNRDLGTLAPEGDQWRLEFVRTLHHPPEKVWRALTEPEHLRAWFPADIVGDRRAGASLQFVFRENEGPTLGGEMLVYDPPTALEFRWNDETMRFDLEPTPEGTRLTFVNVFGELGKAARDAAGWHACLDMLDCEVGGEKPAWSPKDRWRDVHDLYVEALGPEAATIGPPE